MSLKPESIGPVPRETVRVARAAFPKGNLYMRMRDELGPIFEDPAFASLFSARGRPAEAPWRLALATVMQYVEALSDRDAADSVRGRIDWKYALGLELEDPGFDSTVLCEFRARLAAGDAEQLILDRLLELCRERKWIKARGKQRTDSTHVLAAIRAINRLDFARETMRHALESLAEAAPEWLKDHSEPGWVERYRQRDRAWRKSSKKEDEGALATAIGVDGHVLVSAVYALDAPEWLRKLPPVETLRRVWVQQYYVENGVVRHRGKTEGLPPSSICIRSPYDLDARLAKKKKDEPPWVGYKVHLTETCEEGEPRLITHVETTPGPLADGDVTPDIHQALERKGLTPGMHLVDSAYMNAEQMVAAKLEYGVDLVGPTMSDTGWQAREGLGFDASNFVVDWQRKTVTCPEGRTSVTWSPTEDSSHKKRRIIQVHFSRRDCGSCRSRIQCTRAPMRNVTLRPRRQYSALRKARLRERSAEFAAVYRSRAGIEGTLSQGVRSSKLRRSRYIGLAKTRLQHVLTAVAIDFERIGNWLVNTTPAATRHSRFSRLMLQQSKV